MPEIMHLIADARRAAFAHRFDDAAAHASSVLGDLPGCLLALRALAWAQLELHQDAARATFEACAAYDPEDALAYVGQAIWHQRRRDTPAAVGNWTRAWELDSDNQAIRRALVNLTGDLPESAFADAICLIRAGRPDEAIEPLLRLRAERAADTAVSLVLMAALWESGRQAEAGEVAVAVHARTRSVKAALYVAAVEDRAGRTLHSREAIARAEQVDPDLSVFADVVRQVGLQPVLELHCASRSLLAVAR